MQKAVPTMMVRLNTAEGFIVDLPLMGQRFLHRDSGKASLDFTVYTEWSILEALAKPILFFNPFCVVELGAGKSTVGLAKAAQEMGVTLHTVDKRPDKKVQYFENHIYHHMLTEEFMDDFDDTPALVLIDADHSYEMSKREFEFFYKKLVIGGVIFLHDTFPPHEFYLRPTGCDDVYKLRREIEDRRDELDCDVFTWPYTAQFMGLTMVIKKDPERPYFGR